MTELGEPTPERKRRSAFIVGPAVATEHGPAQAGQRVYRAQSVIQRLAKAGVLSPPQAQAAERLRADWELGPLGARDSRSGPGGHTGWSYAEATLAASRRFDEACKALGPTKLVVLDVVLLECSLSQLAKAWNANRQELAGVLKVGLHELANHYGIADLDKPKRATPTSR